MTTEVTNRCCLQLDAKTLRTELVPVTSAALERIKLLLLSMARQATLAVLDDITARIQQLSARPTQLDDFVGYMVGGVLVEGLQLSLYQLTAACAVFVCLCVAHV
jgi:hypothetical protein